MARRFHQFILRGWWFMMAECFRVLWQVFRIPERWLAQRLFHAQQRHARLLPLPKGFDPASGRLFQS